ncbi:class F sortase [Arthrobacter tecti]
MISSNNGRRRGFAVSAAAALLILTGCGSTPGSDGAQAPSTTTAPASSAPASPAPSVAETAPVAEPAPAESLPPVMEASEPVSFTIPSIGAGSELLSLGIRENGSLEVPPDGPGAPASWYNQSPTPGERGPSVLLGHVNATDGGPGVFADLRSLKPGDRIDVLRADGSTATFEVTRGEQYPKNDFPTATVYGYTPESEIRLITCDGYDPATGLFDDNYVIFATLVI